MTSYEYIFYKDIKEPKLCRLYGRKAGISTYAYSLRLPCTSASLFDEAIQQNLDHFHKGLEYYIYCNDVKIFLINKTNPEAPPLQLYYRDYDRESAKFYYKNGENIEFNNDTNYYNLAYGRKINGFLIDDTEINALNHRIDPSDLKQEIENFHQKIRASEALDIVYKEYGKSYQNVTDDEFRRFVKRIYPEVQFSERYYTLLAFMCGRLEGMTKK